MPAPLVLFVLLLTRRCDLSTAIYYFSGTGNSLHVARGLQRRISESELVPIVRLLSEDTIRMEAETVGLVFPNFCLTVPIPVHDFLEKVDVGPAEYVFAVCTRGGTPSEAFDYINAQLRKQGKRLDAETNVTMPWNHPLGKQDLPGAATEERVQHLESAMAQKLDAFAAFVLARAPYVRPDTDATLELPGWTQTMTSLIPIFGWPLTAFLDAEAAHSALTGLTFGYLGLMLLSIVAAFAHDIEQTVDTGTSYR